MDFFVDLFSTLVVQFQKPTLAFLIAGMFLAAIGSKLELPEQVYKFIVMLLLLKVGMNGGIAIRDGGIGALLLPVAGAILVGITIVLIGIYFLKQFKKVDILDATATAGLFGAVSASTLAAGMAVLEDENISYEGYIGALYPFMDIAALVTAIILGKLAQNRTNAPYKTRQTTRSLLGNILVDTIRSGPISALLVGILLGLLARPDTVFDSFYEPLFRGLLSLLMLSMGMEAYARLHQLKGVGHIYILYGITAPLLHGLIGFSTGLLLHYLTGFSAGGIILLAVMAASSSDISGPPTLKAALPEANPSAYVGTSTGLGTPVAILSIPIWMTLAQTLLP